uniref:Dishevelled-binding antagonist of beta-catenin 3a n=1 Tax=Cynoglossus semilaevis TaxID=244447 RepID=A0A3P8WQ87_CYNSE
MFPAFSLPMKAERSRNKERLEASLAGLCELELLKQRQERGGLKALCPRDVPFAGRPPWGALRSTRCNTLQCFPLGVKSSLEQQVAELKVNAEVKSTEPPTDLDDKRLSSGKAICRPMESKYLRSHSAPEGSRETGTGESWQSFPTRQLSVTDAIREMRDVDLILEDYQQAQKVETYILGLIQRRALPTRPSKPRTSLAHDARAVTLVRQSSLCHKEEHHSTKQASRYHGTEFTEDAPPPYHHLQKVQHQTGFYPKPRQASGVTTSGSASPEYPSHVVLQGHQDSSNSENDSLQHFHNYHVHAAQTKAQHPTSPDEQLVNAEYIPAQPCQASARAYAHHHSNPHKSAGHPKANRHAFSPERTSHSQPAKCRGGPKKCRLNEEKSGGSKKPGKKACRSQSENSLQRVPERKYNTVERDGGGSGSGGKGGRSSQSKSKKQPQGSGNYRRWQSTLELSQDEAEQPPVTAAPVQPHHSSHHHQHVEYHIERDQVQVCKPSEDYTHQGPGESESSTSEADSPDSSSLSSDSDESGGLVWPQQLPPQLSLPSPPAPSGAPMQPKAFVKIKASHALKKKILRFRTGSLKVMTTV